MKREKLATLRIFENGEYIVLSPNNLILDEGFFNREDDEDIEHVRWYDDNGYVDCMADTWTI